MVGLGSADRRTDSILFFSAGDNGVSTYSLQLIVIMQIRVMMDNRFMKFHPFGGVTKRLMVRIIFLVYLGTARIYLAGTERVSTS